MNTQDTTTQALPTNAAEFEALIGMIEPGRLAHLDALITAINGLRGDTPPSERAHHAARRERGYYSRKVWVVGKTHVDPDEDEDTFGLEDAARHLRMAFGIAGALVANGLIDVDLNNDGWAAHYNHVVSAISDALDSLS